jgi:hypothetical protein
MKSSHSATIILVTAWMTFLPLAGCGGKKNAPAPEQKEEQRQKLIKNAERMQRESK